MNAPAAPAKDSAEGNVKETIESIIVAFILAFVFRAFVVEAFVIPTGSMAPTLMGAHLRYRCEDCGYEFAVNYSTGDPDDSNIPSRANDNLTDADGRPISRVYHVICPNCGYRVQKRRGDGDADNSADNPPVHYGDRILVLKYLYLLKPPQRWDVVVFKSPNEPHKYDYQQNYIKRLIGLPGETIMLLDGDVYVAKNEDPRIDPKPGDFVVQTKPQAAQNALWRIVHDNDYYPQNVAVGRARNTESLWKQPWTAIPEMRGWKLDGRVFQFDNSHGGGEIVFDASVNRDKQALTDWLAYDVSMNQGREWDARFPDGPNAFNRRLYTADNNVSDVRLSFHYQRTGGDGALRAQLIKVDHTFTAEITAGKATLLKRVNKGPDEVIGSASFDGDPSDPLRIDFINCDYRVTLRINGRDVIQTNPQQYHPDIPMLLDAFAGRRSFEKSTIRIGAEKQQCLISHLSLWRDVYYMNRRLGGEPVDHATPESYPRLLMRLSASPGEYFCCGDNSPMSGDGRQWTDKINLPREGLKVEDGKVPERFLLGKAFFVYWPAGFRPIDSAPALVPDFGDMRFIH